MAPSNGYFFHNNLLDEATITPSNEETKLPASNLQDARVTAKWYTEDTELDEYLEIDLASAQDVSGFGLAGHNISSTVTKLKIRGHTDNVSWGGAVDTEIDLLDLGGIGYSAYQAGPIIWYSTISNKRYWRYEVADPYNPAGHFEHGRLFLGSYTTFSSDTIALLNFLRIDLSETIMSIDKRTPYSNIKAIITEIRCLLQQKIDKTKYGSDDLDSLLTLFNSIGTNKDFFFSLNPDLGSDYGTNRYKNLKRLTVYGRLLKSLELAVKGNKVYNAPINIRES